ncbi:MAG: class I SAM-dependent RNA methyltransferase [Bacteroidetes bacterium]|nr:class I SAM-dependent RNA methyltransferase [Bacteroidota bacterium]
MSIFNLKSDIRITCPKYIGPFLKQEVEALEYTVDSHDLTGVNITGTLQDCMMLNLWLRTAHKVLFLLDEFTAKTPDDLYNNVITLPWEEYIAEDGYFTVSSTVHNDYINDTRFPNLRVKDAIADRILEKKNRRPDSGNEDNRTAIYLYWNEKDASVFIDTSGETIAKHGYRNLPHKAPMQETLAAAVIIASGWDKTTPFINPMCGSGTLAIEAALMAINKAPGLMRNNFGFMHILGFEDSVWQQMRKEATAEILPPPAYKIIASDIEAMAMKATFNNARDAGVQQCIAYETVPFEDTTLPEGNAYILMNPEYGIRMGEEVKLAETYTEIGAYFKQKCQGKKAFVFTGNLELAKNIGLKTTRRTEFYNGKIDCRLFSYDIYEGSKRLPRELQE